MSIMAKIMIIQNGKKLTDADHTNPLQLKTILILVKNNFDKDKSIDHQNHQENATLTNICSKVAAKHEADSQRQVKK